MRSTIRKITLLLSLFFFAQATYSQGCLSQGIQFKTQSQIDSFPINYPGCTTIWGKVSLLGGTPTDPITNLQGLSSIREFKQDLWLGNLDSLKNFAGLDNLDTIGNYFIIANCNQLESLQGLSNLKYIGRKFSLEGLDSLRDFSGIGPIDTLNSFEITHNNRLKNFVGLESLTYIKGDFTAWGGFIEQFTGLEQLKGIGNQFRLEGLSELKNFEGLENLTQITGKVTITGADSLTSFSGLNHLQQIGSLVIIGASVSDMSGLEALTSIHGNLDIGSTKIKNFSGLDNLTSLHGALTIYQNNLLTSLSGIHNIDPYTIKNYSSQSTALDLDITYNSLLSSCEVQSICSFLTIPNRKIRFSQNATGCNTAEEIQCSSTGVSGRVYYDWNHNQQFDDIEGIIGRRTISFPSLGLINITGTDGIFYQACEPDSVYTFGWKGDPNWILTSDSVYTVTFDPNVDNNHYDFGIIPIYLEHTGEINLTSYFTRCNKDVNFYLRYANTGTYSEEPNVVIHYDSTCTFISASAYVIHDSVAHTLTKPSLLWPFQFKDMTIQFAMPDETSTGAPLTFLSKLYRIDSMGIEILMDSFLYESVVLCSLDPNDKQVSPVGKQDAHYTLHDQRLTYTVRFQNTGNAPAIDVDILDTLDNNLDISTLRVINSSAPVNTRIKGQAISFLFKNIWLPDSLSNEPESHGFVTYEVFPKAELSDYTVLENTAHIVFDANPAIVTNTVFNTMVTTIPVLDLAEKRNASINVSPNPGSGVIHFSLSSGERHSSYQIYNVKGQLVGQLKANSIDVSHFSKGVYFAKTLVGQQVVVVKFLVE